MTRHVHGLRRSLRARVKRWLSQPAMILAYHRVACEEYDPWSLCTTPDHFEQHLALLRRYARPISLTQFVREMTQGSLAKGSVAVTFDDGYADNLHQALPLLQRYEIPATFFLVSSGIGSNREFWWDALERCIFEPIVLPSNLRLRLGDSSFYLSVPQSSDQRRALYEELWGELKAASEDVRTEALDRVHAWSGIDIKPRPSRRPMNHTEVLSLAADRLCEIGAHTMSHPQLAGLSEDDQMHEIAKGRQQLEETLDRAVSGFAYPFGNRGDYDDTTVALLKRLGFSYGVTIGGRVPRWAPDRFELPRIYMTNMNGERFSAFIRNNLMVEVS